MIFFSSLLHNPKIRPCLRGYACFFQKATQLKNHYCRSMIAVQWRNQIHLFCNPNSVNSGQEQNCRELGRRSSSNGFSPHWWLLPLHPSGRHLLPRFSRKTDCRLIQKKNPKKLPCTMIPKPSGEDITIPVVQKDGETSNIQNSSRYLQHSPVM